MDGPYTILVDPASAVHAQECRKSRVESLPINRAHSYMVKYSLQDQEYQTVVRNLSDLMQTARRVLLPRIHGEDSGKCLCLAVYLLNSGRIYRDLHCCYTRKLNVIGLIGHIY